MHIIQLKTVGSITATAVHLILPVSFFMVKIVVAQGQWNSENNITDIAVYIVHPFAMKSSRIAVIDNSHKAPVFR